MTHFLMVVSLVLAQVGDVRVRAPEKPFECAYSRSFCFDAGGGKMACLTQLNQLLFWNGESDDPIVVALEKKDRVRRHERFPMSGLLTRDGREAIVFYYDGRVQVWSTETNAKLREMMCDRTRLHTAQLSPDGETAAVLSYDYEIRKGAILFWKTNDWSFAGAIESEERINNYCFSPDGRELLIAAGHPTDQKDLGFTGILAWDIETKKETGRIEYGSGFPIRIAVSPDSRWVAVGGGDAVPQGIGRSLSGHLRIFDWKAKEFVVEPYTLDSDYVRAVLFSPDGTRLYSSADSPPSSVRAFNVGDWAPLWTAAVGSGIHEMSLSPSGQDIVVPANNELKIVDAKDGVVRGLLLKFRFYPEEAEGDESE